MSPACRVIEKQSANIKACRRSHARLTVCRKDQCEHELRFGWSTYTKKLRFFDFSVRLQQGKLVAHLLERFRRGFQLATRYFYSLRKPSYNTTLSLAAWAMWFFIR